MRVVDHLFDANLADGANCTRYVQWDGGDGWLGVNGSFLGGGGAFLSVGYQRNEDQGVGFSVNPHPDFPSGVTAFGTHKFSAPKGVLVFVASAPNPGDTVVVSASILTLDKVTT